jgi:hypothetical protein
MESLSPCSFLFIFAALVSKRSAAAEREDAAGETNKMGGETQEEWKVTHDQSKILAQDISAVLTEACSRVPKARAGCSRYW